MHPFVVGMGLVAYREILRFFRNKARATSSLASPLLWIGIFGFGMQGALKASPLGHTLSYVDYLVPGVVIQTALFAGIFGALSIVVDREFGFVRELLISPVPRSAVAMGKIVGAALIATFQGVLTLLVSFTIGAKIRFWQFLGYLPAIFLFSLTASAIGFLVASRIRSQEAFQAIVPILIFPLFFLSDALFPLKTAPKPVQLFAAINPVTYGVGLLRSISVATGIPANWPGSTNATHPLAQVLVLFFFFMVFASLGTLFFAGTEE